MPATATITAYYNFTAGTKAKASQVQNNFDVERGHKIPVNTSTATAADNTYDLGSTDYQWANLYVVNPPVINGVNSSVFEVESMFDGQKPPQIVDTFESTTDLYRLKFLSGQDNDVRFNFEVPAEYVTGNQIKLRFWGYTDDTATGFQLQTETTLYNALDVATTTAPSDVLTTTVNITSPTTTGTLLVTTSAALTDASGLINSVTVTAGDLLAVNFKRVGSATADSMTGSFFLNNLLVDLNG